jgi:hypothetical protein
MYVSAKDTFSKFMFFSDASGISFGTSEVFGDVHSNQGLSFNFGGAKFHNDVSAVTGYTYGSGATTANTTFMAASDPYGPAIAMPSSATITAMQSNATGPYNVNGNAAVTLLGSQVKIDMLDSSGGVLSTGTYPAPPNGLIYVNGNVTLKGDTSSRFTIGTSGSVSITDKIRYQDNSGNLAYTLSRNGVPQAGNQGVAGEAWTAVNGYTYDPNPNYQPTTPPTLGIVAINDITIAPSAPNDMEVHASNYSNTSRFSADLSYKKGNLRVLGSVVGHFGGWRYNSAGYGYALSGQYLYDVNLANNPPPFFPGVPAPVAGGRYVTGN